MCGIVGYFGNKEAHQYWWKVLENWNIEDTIQQESQL